MSALTTDDTGGAPGSQPSDHAVKERSVQQRQPEPGEPVCVICGRYGEYISAATDEDVCSLECKAVSLARSTPAPPALLDPFNSRGTVVASSALLPDECVVVRDTGNKLPEWTPDESIAKLSQKQVDALLQGIEVSVKGEDVPRPILQFLDCKFLPKLQENLEAAGYDSPTPVQMQAIPAALSGRDALVSAETGSGKTASFLLPIIMRCSLVRMYGLSERDKPIAMVLAPTRELCAQVEEQAKVLGKGLPFKTALVVGGDALPQQLHRIKHGVELMIGTPRRLIDLLSKHDDLRLQDVCMLVLDEVDCMLERGFRDQVMQIVHALSNPQVLMYSATIPPDIERFSSSLLKNPLLVSVGTPSQPNRAVQQTVLWVESKNKKKKLFEILKSRLHYRPPAVVFVNSRMGSDLLAEAIRSVTGIKAMSVHGEKSMKDRRETMKSFLTGETSVIVATGLLGRGLDLLRMTQVIVFDFPSSIQEYIHMIGRASRLGSPGSAIVFLDNESKALFKDLVALLRASGTAIPRELLNSPYLYSTYALAYNKKKRRRKQDVDTDSE